MFCKTISWLNRYYKYSYHVVPIDLNKYIIHPIFKGKCRSCEYVTYSTIHLLSLADKLYSSILTNKVRSILLS